MSRLLSSPWFLVVVVSLRCLRPELALDLRLIEPKPFRTLAACGLSRHMVEVWYYKLSRASFLNADFLNVGGAILHAAPPAVL